MWGALRSRILSSSSSPSSSSFLIQQLQKLGAVGHNRGLCSPAIDGGGISISNTRTNNTGFLNLDEVEKILSDVKADDVKVIPVKNNREFTDFMVVATGRSAWHVRNIAQALIYKVKQKQKGAERMLLPSVEGQEGGHWVVIDTGSLIIHALDEKARSYYNLDKLWTTEESIKDKNQDLGKAFVKVRRKNNSKKLAKPSA